MPVANREYWGRKIDRNRERDSDARQRLAKLGWKTLVVWECKVKDLIQIELTLKKFLC